MMMMIVFKIGLLFVSNSEIPQEFIIRFCQHVFVFVFVFNSSVINQWIYQEISIKT